MDGKINKIFGGILLLILLAGSLFYFLPLNKNNKEIRCDDVVFIKPSEINLASEIIEKTNALVVIPETKEVLGSVEFLKKCPNFDVLKYIGGNIWAFGVG